MTMIYKAKEVMDQLDLKDSVFKKYIALLEREGYVIQRNPQGHRLFTDDDIKTLETFIELSKYDGMTLESVAKKISSMKGHDGTTVVDKQGYDVMALVEMAVSSALEKQAREHSAQLQQLQEQLNRIESKQEERDLTLVQSLKESLEIKKLLLEGQNQTAATKEDSKKGIIAHWFARLFG